MSEVVGITKTNGSADNRKNGSFPNGEQNNQVLTGSLGHLVVDVNGDADVSAFGYDAGEDHKGEELLRLLASVVNPIIIKPVDENVIFVAHELNGVDASVIQDVINASETFGNVTVTRGEYTVDTGAEPEPIEYTVTFDLGDGTLVSGDLVQTVLQGSDAVAPVVDAPEGFEFVEWDVAFTNVQGDITVTAVYELTTYTVTFDIGNGTLVSGDLVQQVVEGEDAVAPTIESHEGFEFIEWDTDFTNVTTDITVTAIYEHITNTVTFDIGNGTLVSGNLVQEIEDGASAEAPVIDPPEGYTFIEWDTSFDNVSDDITVTAIYEQITNTVTFDIGNGTLVSGDLVQEVAYGEDAEAPVLTAPANFTFVEWDVAFTNVQGDITVTAVYEPIEYTVTFDLGDGTLVSGDLVQTVQQGSAAAAPVVDAPANFTFVEWDTDFTNVQGDITVTAVYEPIEYTVTFDLGDGTLVSGDLVQTVQQGSDAVAPTITPAAGFTFIEWDVAFTNVQDDITITAVYEQITSTVTFNIGDGQRTGGGDLVQIVAYGEDAEAPVLNAPEGFEFIEWDADFTNVQDDITVNALYEQITNTVTFDLGDGTLVSGDLVQIVAYGEDAEAPVLTAPAGFEFIEWDTDFTNITGDITVTAVYEPIEYTVTFAIGDGTLVSGDLVQTVQYGNDAAAPVIEAPAGFDFVEWDVAFTNVQGDITVTAVYEQITNTVTFDIGDGQRTGGGDLVQTVAYGEAAVAPTIESPAGFTFVEWDVAFTSVTGDITVTAVYEPIEFIVTFNIGGGELVSGDLAQAIDQGGSATAPEIIAPEGYQFTGWDGDFTNVTEDIEITAIYELLSFNVTFEIGEGERVGGGELEQEVSFGEDAEAPELNAPEGFTFVEWDTDFTNVQDDITVTAVYEPIEYLVTFDIGDGILVSGDLAQTVQQGGDAIAPTVTPAAGFTFVEWDTDFTNVQGDITVTAVYEPIEYTVTFDIGTGTLVSGDLVQTVQHGSDAVAPTITPAAGFDFVEWDASFDNVTTDITVNAVYEPIEFIVTFDLGDGQRTGGGDLVQVVAYGEDAEAPQIEAPDGFIFVEWDKDFTDVDSNLDVNAVYEDDGDGDGEGDGDGGGDGDGDTNPGDGDGDGGGDGDGEGDGDGGGEGDGDGGGDEYFNPQNDFSFGSVETVPTSRNVAPVKFEDIGDYLFVSNGSNDNAPTFIINKETNEATQIEELSGCNNYHYHDGKVYCRRGTNPRIAIYDTSDGSIEEIDRSDLVHFSLAGAGIYADENHIILGNSPTNAGQPCLYYLNADTKQLDFVINGSNSIQKIYKYGDLTIGQTAGPSGHIYIYSDGSQIVRHLQVADSFLLGNILYALRSGTQTKMVTAFDMNDPSGSGVDLDLPDGTGNRIYVDDAYIYIMYNSEPFLRVFSRRDLQEIEDFNQNYNITSRVMSIYTDIDHVWVGKGFTPDMIQKISKQ